MVFKFVLEFYKEQKMIIFLKVEIKTDVLEKLKL